MSIKTFKDVGEHFANEVRNPSPEWNSETTRVHDWRNYVGENVRRIWPALSYDTRLAIALDAQEMADREEWE